MENAKQFALPIILKGENYLLWARTSKTAIRGRGLWSHIEPKDGEEAKLIPEKEKEEPTPEEEKWSQEDQLVLAAIQNSLEGSILEGYSYCETAKELWETLKGVYGNTSNLTRVFEVKKAINTLHQEDNDFKKHFGRFRSLWAELEMLRPSTVDPKVLNERREQDKVFALLFTLNPCFNELVKHILRGDKLPSLDDVSSQIQKEQGSMGLFNKEELIMANNVEVPTASKVEYKREFERRTIVCDHCKKPGHKKFQCWFLHPHLKTNNNRFNKDQPRANYVGEASNGQTKEASGDIVMKKADFEAIIQSVASKMNSGY